MRKGWIAMVVCAALCACGQGTEKSGGANGSARSVAGVDHAPPPSFVVCSSCHSVEQGRNSSGPSLFGVMGRKAGSAPGYPYSDALKGSGIVWDAKSLDTWLQGPIKMVPGTKMVYPVSDPGGRKAVIDYLETLK